MYEVNISPVLFQFLGFEIRYYGLVFVLGIFLTYFYLKKQEVLNKEELERFMFYLVIGMFVGARVFGIVSNNPSLLFKDPLELFRIWNGGMSFFGGLLGSVIGSWIVLKKNNVKLIEIGDRVVVPVSFVLIFGRLANFVNQELVGTVTNVNWCFNFISSEGCRHPYQLYSAFWHLILFLIIYFLSKQTYRRGRLFFTFILGYGVFRFVTDFFKERIVLFGLSVWQYLSLMLIVVGIYYFWKNKKRATS